MPRGIGVGREMTRIILDPDENPENRPSSSAAGRRRSSETGRIGESEMTLIDPFTKEEIAKTVDYVTQEDIDNGSKWKKEDLGKFKYDNATGDQKYIVRDNWFRIDAKFKWKNAPIQPGDGTTDMPSGFF